MGLIMEIKSQIRFNLVLKDFKLTWMMLNSDLDRNHKELLYCVSRIFEVTSWFYIAFERISVTFLAAKQYKVGKRLSQILQL